MLDATGGRKDSKGCLLGGCLLWMAREQIIDITPEVGRRRSEKLHLQKDKLWMKGDRIYT